MTLQNEYPIIIMSKSKRQEILKKKNLSKRVADFKATVLIENNGL